MTIPTLLEINAEAVREAARSLAVDRGMAREMAMRSGPGTAPPAPKLAAAPPSPAATPAAAAPASPPKGWDARRPSSMAALDAARRQREAKGGR
jgi:hypothetical protein